MKKKLIKFLLYSIGALVLIYGSIWLLSQFNEAFPTYFTVYTEDFNEDSFNKISIGDDRKLVESLIGKPLLESTTNVNRDSIQIVYWYSKNKYYGFSYDLIYISFYDDKVSSIKRMVVMD